MATIIEQLDAILAAVRTRLATELSATEAEILLHSLNFESTAPLKISLTYDVLTQSQFDFETKEQPRYLTAGVQMAMFRYVLPINDRDGAEAERKAAIDQVQELSVYIAEEVSLYRAAEYGTNQALNRIAQLSDYSTTIATSFGWDNQQSSEGRYRIALYDFSLVACTNH